MYCRLPNSNRPSFFLKSLIKLPSNYPTFLSHSLQIVLPSRPNYALNDTKIIVRKVFPYVLLGVLIGAVIHNWIPQEFILTILGNNNPFAVILATVIGVPIYADIFGTLPIAEALYLVGVPAGTILALMMAITALSLPSLIMLSQVLQRKLLFLFIGIVSIGIIFVGYIFNLVF